MSSYSKEQELSNVVNKILNERRCWLVYFVDFKCLNVSAMYTPRDVNGYYTIKRKNETPATMCVVISFFYLYNGWRKVEKN